VGKTDGDLCVKFSICGEGVEWERWGGTLGVSMGGDWIFLVARKTMVALIVAARSRLHH
jgi:hypothetical protein